MTDRQTTAKSQKDIKGWYDNEIRRIKERSWDTASFCCKFAPNQDVMTAFLCKRWELESQGKSDPEIVLALLSTLVDGLNTGKWPKPPKEA